jgi:hypothetical protein
VSSEKREGSNSGWLITLIAVVILLLPSATVLAQSGGGYDLTWNTIDNGGILSSGGDYTLHGTIGQADAGELAGGGYTLAGGFWRSAAVAHYIYLPLVLRSH